MDAPPPAYAAVSEAKGGAGAGAAAPASGFPQHEQIKLWDSVKERRMYGELADLYAVIKTTEALERAFIRDLVDKQKYTEMCQKLIGQFKGAEMGLSRDQSVKTVEEFMEQYRMDAPRAVDRLVRGGVPATVVHAGTDDRGSELHVAETVQDFITCMDGLKLNYRAVDSIQPLFSDLANSINKNQGLPAQFEPAEIIKKWLVTLNAMRAVDEIDEDQARQMSHDLDKAYGGFHKFLAHQK